MLRLFLSLYLLISIGLVLINYSSTIIFSKFETNIQSDKFSDIETLSQLASGYAQLLQTNQVDIDSLSKALPYPLQLIERNSIALLPEQSKQLSEQRVISLFNNDSSLLLYAQIEQSSLLQLGPIELTPATPAKLKHWLILLSYLLLALLILAWSRPLWRDLSVLVNMTKQVSANQPELTGSVSKNSVLAPMYRALISMSERITELITIQKQMIHAVSHDIRTPLARMKFSVAMMQQNGNQGENLQATKQSLVSDIREIEELLDNLLSFGRIENNKVELDKQEVELSSLLTNLIEKLMPLSALNISSEIPSGILYFCDGHLLERAIQNLIVNAQKYGISTIRVTLKEQANEISIAVEDDGVGIPEQKIEKVLQPFTRLEKSRNKNSGGFGLGLAIVSRIVHWHQGQLTINKSSLGGAKVTVNLRK